MRSNLLVTVGIGSDSRQIRLPAGYRVPYFDVSAMLCTVDGVP